MVRINDFLELLLPFSNPAVIDVLTLLVIHGTHREGDELRQSQLSITILVYKKSNNCSQMLRVPAGNSC